MLKRIVFLTFLISLAYGQDVEADSAIEGYEQAEEELLESIKKESNKSEKKRKRKQTLKKSKHNPFQVDAL